MWHPSQTMQASRWSVRPDINPGRYKHCIHLMAAKCGTQGGSTSSFDRADVSPPGNVRRPEPPGMLAHQGPPVQFLIALQAHAPYWQTENSYRHLIRYKKKIVAHYSQSATHVIKLASYILFFFIYARSACVS